MKRIFSFSSGILNRFAIGLAILSPSALRILRPNASARRRRVPTRQQSPPLDGATCGFDLGARGLADSVHTHGHFARHFAVAQDLDRLLPPASRCARENFGRDLVLAQRRQLPRRSRPRYPPGTGREAALRHAPLQRHLAAFEPRRNAMMSGACLLTLVALAGRLAFTRAGAAPETLAALVRAFGRLRLCRSVIYSSLSALFGTGSRAPARERAAPGASPISFTFTR